MPDELLAVLLPFVPSPTYQILKLSADEPLVSFSRTILSNLKVPGDLKLIPQFSS